MKIFICQTNPKVGDLEENYNSILRYYTNALNLNADICLFPELATSGYFAEDLFTQKKFLKDVDARVDKLISMTKDVCLVLPTPILEEDGLLYNGVVVAQYGKIIGKTYKHELPNYGIFDEERYFTKGTPSIIVINNKKIGIPICEDIWFSKVCSNLKNQGAELFLVPNGSPYEKGKMQERVTIAKQRFTETQVPIIYCNQALGHDGIVFDGRSFCYDGEIKVIAKAFETDQQLLEITNNKFHPTPVTYNLNLSIYDEIFSAMVLGLRDYVVNNGFKKAVLGLSGGIDSALVAVIATEALGKENVITYMLSSKFTSQESIEDAKTIATNLNIPLKYINISKIFESFLSTLGKDKAIEENSLTFQNLQSRIRGTILMAKANETNSLLITTGNKSEYATGYATIYGDMNGAFNPIKDIYKTELYKLVEYINKLNIIPERVITKAPTAELTLGQKDSDSLPEYYILDKIIEDYVENNLDQYLLSKKYDPATVEHVIRLIRNAEFKRKQSAPGVKISKRNFEKDRRFPITNLYK